jgi:prepilin-type N-terminal cleavage/methylation domain-containing protein
MRAGVNTVANNGFTLIEMLIALVLSGIIFVSAYQIMSNLIQYQVRAAKKAETQQDELLLRNLLTELIGKGLPQSQLYFRIQRTPLFSGKAESLQIVSRAFSSHFDVPGYRVYRLFRKDGNLTVAYRRYDRDSINKEAQELDTGLKVDDVEFAYLSEGIWVDHWPDDSSFPQWIRVKIDFPDNNIHQSVYRTGWL